MASSTLSERKPLSSILPPLVLGSATFNHQYNADPFALPSTEIVHRALKSGIRAFDTSPYYGPAEILLGQALQSQSFVPRSDYVLLTKCGRIAAEEFDYSPEWIRRSIDRSLKRLGTDYLDLVFCHDVEFVDPKAVIIAVRTLRELRDEGKIRYVGISGYPVEVLVELAKKIKEETGEALDGVQSYAHHTLQNTKLRSIGLKGLHEEAGVDCILNGSPLGMGLLRKQGVPVGAMGDFHPAPKELRERCQIASDFCEEFGGDGEKLATLALRFAIEGWAEAGTSAGTAVKPLGGADGKLRKINVPGKIGVCVTGVSSITELEELLEIWRDVVRALERKFLYEGVKATFDAGGADSADWKDYSWPSPGEGFVVKKL
ncbi:hypothetical protein RUND412_009216 [Rhizina undulata]